MSRDPYTALVSGLLFPLHERLKGHTSVAVRRAMEDSQWHSPAQLQAAQAERLSRFVTDVYAHVPYYRQVFDAHGVQPTQIQTSADLARLPLLSKADIRAAGTALRADDACGLTRCNTGGSSGEPLVFWLGQERVSHDVAAKWRATRWWGVDIGDPELVVWGSPIELGAQDRLRALRDGLLRTQLLPAFAMSASNLDSFVTTIRERRPRMLFGYPSSLALIARHARERGQRLDDLGIRVAFVTSERLYDDQREAIAQVFRCPVANGYGGRDAGFIAHACPHGRLHLTVEDIVVEIIDGAGRVLPPGETGEIVITHLATRDFPFIRYRTGDIGALGSAACPCGRGLAVLERLEGRSTDFVVARDGTVMHGLALIYVLRDLPEIARFKIIQESLTRTRVLLVPTRALAPALHAQIRAAFQRRLGSVEVAIEEVADIPAERSGKYRYVVSNVAASAAGPAGGGRSTMEP